MGDCIVGGVAEGGGLVTFGDGEPVGVPILPCGLDPDIEVGGKINFPLSNDFAMVVGERQKDCFMRASADVVVGGGPPASMW